MGITISIANQKGGAGKTTTAVCLAGALAQKKKKILLIDADHQSASASLILIPQNNAHCGVSSLLIGEPFEPIETENFDVLPSNHVLAQTAESLSNIKMPQARNKKLKTALGENGVYEKYDYIIIDCPPSHSVITYNALWASDFCIIPMRPDDMHVTALEDMLAIIEVAQEQGANITPLGIFMICFDKRMKLHSHIYDKIKEKYPDLLCNSTVRNNVHLSELATFHKDIFAHDKNSNGAKDYTDVANEITKKIKRTK
jgi:chromosome partitioning protein